MLCYGFPTHASVAIFAQAFVFCQMRGRGRGRPVGRRVESDDAALAALAGLGAPEAPEAKKARWMPPQRGPEKALWMRSQKADYSHQDYAREQESRLAASRADVSAMADIAGVHVRQCHDKGQLGGHHRSWSPFQMLRAAFAPVSSTAFGLVVGCGHSTASDAKAAVASCLLHSQAAAVQRVFEADDDIAWAVVSKMHDATRLEVTVPQDPDNN
jgi:hypothetical protein